MTDSILYEFPLNERVRLFMRLENLFQEIEYFIAGPSAWDARAAMSSLIEMVTLLTRYDLKSELLKEIERHNQLLMRLLGNPNVDETKVAKIKTDLEEVGNQLYRSTGKPGQSSLETDLFKAVSQRSSMPGGSCSFDLPSFHYWLEQDSACRKADLKQWLQPFATVNTAVELLMGFLRNSARVSQETAHQGYFQRTLDHSLSFQLLRIFIDRRYPCFAEISGGKHRFTVRLLTHSLTDKPSPFPDDVDFRLACCTI